MQKPNSFWNYLPMFERHKKNNTVFFETGTHKGESVADALYLGFEHIYSVEILPEFYNYCVDKFKDNPNVHLYLGDSNVKMPEMLEQITAPTLFWLDGHHGLGDPVWKELEFIQQHPIKTHTIIIDDIHILYPNQLDDLKAAILKINPDYKFYMEPQATSQYTTQGQGIENGHLVAYCD